MPGTGPSVKMVAVSPGPSVMITVVWSPGPAGNVLVPGIGPVVKIVSVSSLHAQLVSANLAGGSP